MRLSRRLLWAIAAVTCVSLVSSVAYATQTGQMWDFLENVKGPMPADIDNNPFGTPQLRIITNGIWQSADGTHQGIWPITGEIDAIVPNYDDITREKKEITLTLTWKPWGQDLFIPDQPLIGLVPDYGQPMNYAMDIARTDTPGTDGWTTSVFAIDVYPNPVSEWIAVKGDIYVDMIAIDTICIPEPVTFGIMGLGAVALLGGRKRKLRRNRTK